MERKKIGYYDYTVILTYAGFMFAFLGILQSLDGNFWDAILCLMLAGVCDMFDGVVAATKERSKAEKQFGIQIDSLSDLVSFGVLPGIFVYMLCDKSMVAGLIAVGYILCGLIRLAYFNVLEQARQEETTEKRKSYLGVPITTIAIVLPGVYLLYDSFVVKSRVWFLVLLIGAAVGFLWPVEIKKPQIAGKICLVAVGLMEAAAMFLFAVWGAA